MKIFTHVISLVWMCFLQGCYVQQPSRNDIIGVWVAKDGGKFLFQDDGSFTSENLSGSKIFAGFSEYAKESFMESGTWEIMDSSGVSIVSLNFRKSEKLKSGFSTKLKISGEGLFNRPPWRLLVWIGDPDNMNEYEFKKQTGN